MAVSGSGFEQILVDQHDAVLQITLNRPERMNAWTRQMSAELTSAIEAANADDSVGAIVVTGAGRGFCAGADIGAVFADKTPAPSDAKATNQVSDWVALCRRSKPLIAAVNGASVGVGLTMILPFDQIVASEDAKLSARFVKMGLVPELASSHFLISRCGYGAGSWLALSGTTILGTEAGRIGLVDRVVAADKVLECAMSMATELAANPPTQLRFIKELLTVNAVESDLSLVQQREMERLSEAYETAEHAEAISAFQEKRTPVFRP
ncbi:short chain enoyl-CoA hydratase /enoyl-CoA hydratase [Antricoccus suffuscus]|uniref:Short chain enoyl-CoA hydratase /enoyl-CoA hydratase n=1 Tax=Antricoccus suffuscus TaxID=1629062 RepID=A0A2T1A2G4_9ACTN|nr:enoyl-CoA hydratase-related protein [Antricoccus suffuscus]PRZ42792.1 short chain enoyl-CoA hydratase /enoyl-CoA hydratase [Antricoccus suffuscus]